jgi:hypothetical protein
VLVVWTSEPGDPGIRPILREGHTYIARSCLASPKALRSHRRGCVMRTGVQNENISVPCGLPLEWDFAPARPLGAGQKALRRHPRTAGEEKKPSEEQGTNKHSRGDLRLCVGTGRKRCQAAV